MERIWAGFLPAHFLYVPLHAMKETRYYNVAGHVFSVTAEAECFMLMQNYVPFAIHEYLPLFALTVESGEVPAYSEEMHQEDEGQDIFCGKTADGKPVFEFRWWNESAGALVCSADYRKGRLITTGHHVKFAIDNALMVLYALATAVECTVLFHAAVVSHQDCAYMFLGPSGTGKSTHARLWVKHIKDAVLVNDDNPVVRVFMPSPPDGIPPVEGKVSAMVFGSPWSGKTPCYRNVSYPLGSIVMLSQAPRNEIRRMGSIEAYASLMASISGMRWDERIADGLHQTENALASKVPVWHLDCLPDQAAAVLCWENVKG